VNPELSGADRFYEWLLSDHPGAAHERVRRLLDNQVDQAESLARLRGWLAKIDGLARAGRPLGDSVWGLAEQARGWLIPRAERRLAELGGEPDRVRVRRARSEFETSRRVAKDPDYRYPARYLGPAAAHQPIVADPDRQPWEPEEPASLGQRVHDALATENSPLAWVREHAVQERAESAVRQRSQPTARQAVAPPAGPSGRVRPERRPSDHER
jgi:hypothetical protein